MLMIKKLMFIKNKSQQTINFQVILNKKSYYNSEINYNNLNKK